MIQRENRGNLKIPILSSSKQKGTLLKRKNVPFVHYFLENDEEIINPIKQDNIDNIPVVLKLMLGKRMNTEPKTNPNIEKYVCE